MQQTEIPGSEIKGLEMNAYPTGNHSLTFKFKGAKNMGAEILHWFIIGFFVGIGYGLATWILGKILR